MAIALPVLSALLALVAQTAGAWGAQIIPHRAAYVLSLKSATPSSRIVAAEGAIVFELSEACDGWAVTHRLRLRFRHRDASEVFTESDFTSWETKDGRLYRFDSRLRNDGRVSEAVRGRAEMKGSGGGVAIFSVPSERRVTLPPGTLFPIAHTREVLVRAEAGEFLVWRLVFDGTTVEGLFDVSVVIGKPMKRGAAADFPLLAGKPAWPITIAYFAHGTDKAAPVYQQVTELVDGGMTGDMVLEFDRFTLDAHLKKLEALPRPHC